VIDKVLIEEVCDVMTLRPDLRDLDDIFGVACLIGYHLVHILTRSTVSEGNVYSFPHKDVSQDIKELQEELWYIVDALTTLQGALAVHNMDRSCFLAKNFYDQCLKYVKDPSRKEFNDEELEDMVEQTACGDSRRCPGDEEQYKNLSLRASAEGKLSKASNHWQMKLNIFLWLVVQGTDTSNSPEQARRIKEHCEKFLKADPVYIGMKKAMKPVPVLWDRLLNLGNEVNALSARISKKHLKHYIDHIPAVQAMLRTRGACKTTPSDKYRSLSAESRGLEGNVVAVQSELRDISQGEMDMDQVHRMASLIHHYDSYKERLGALSLKEREVGKLLDVD